MGIGERGCATTVCDLCVDVYRYACSDIVRGYSPSEASEYRAIASFHHPEGYVWGYVRFVSGF